MTLQVQNQLKLQTYSKISLLSFLLKLKKVLNIPIKHLSNFLKNRSHDSFFLSFTDKYEIINIISSLNSKKSVGPNSIPTKIPKLLKMIFLLSFPIFLMFLFQQVSFHLYLKQKRSFLFIKSNFNQITLITVQLPSSFPFIQS